MVPRCIVTVSSGSDGLVHIQGHIDRPRGFWGVNKQKQIINRKKIFVVTARKQERRRDPEHTVVPV